MRSNMECNSHMLQLLGIRLVPHRLQVIPRVLCNTRLRKFLVNPQRSNLQLR
jgi:hypothetical protein